MPVIQGIVSEINDFPLEKLKEYYSEEEFKELKFWINLPYLENLKIIKIKDENFIISGMINITVGDKIYAKIDERFDVFQKEKMPLFLDYKGIIVEKSEGDK